MKKTAYLLLFLCSIMSFSQTQKSTITSLKLGEERNIKLYIPEDYSKDKSYPLIVVLDAEYLFDIVVANTKFFNYNGNMPECIVVGIDQASSRNTDSGYGENGLPNERSAGFFEFIGMELLPAIGKDYRLSDFKTIVGHSQTANFINYYLFKKDPLFDAYIALSPSLAPNMEQNIAEMLSDAQKMKFYYLATGSDDLKENMQRIHILNQNLSVLENEKLHYIFDNIKGADNYSLAAYGIPKAIDKFFDIYKPISREEYNTQILTYVGPVYEYLDNKYKTIESLYGFKKKVSLNDMMAIYAATKKKEDLESLNELSKLAKQEYPDAMMGFFFEAEYFEQMGEPKKAMRTYEKAFGMNEIDFITKDLALDRISKIKEDFGW